jgi:adenylosuccinate synthase
MPEASMAIEVVVGCQWGDEGKGKIVQLLASGKDWVVRFQGGANAGHTIFVGGQRIVLHQVPTGIVEPRTRCAIGGGVVLDPVALVEEIRALEEIGLEVRGRLRISAFTHLVTRLHKASEILEAQDVAIGTTRRGIGPTYAEKATRSGLRMEDASSAAWWEGLRAYWERLTRHAGADERKLAKAAGGTFEEVAAELETALRILEPMICDVTDLLLTEDDRGKRILCEGAQGALLDIDHGTYPYVTSSNTTVGGVCTGLGVPPKRIRRVFGVVKAYTTRVGLGPFPTEMDEPAVVRFREKAGEFGATTGRPRRCGWYDAVLASRACRINGVDDLVVTKLDILSGLEEVLLSVGYAGRREGEATPGWLSTRTMQEIVPKYRAYAGWQEDLGLARTFAALPTQARAYVEALAAETGASLGIVSVGPGRDQILESPSGRERD